MNGGNTSSNSSSNPHAPASSFPLTPLYSPGPGRCGSQTLPPIQTLHNSIDVMEDRGQLQHGLSVKHEIHQPADISNPSPPSQSQPPPHINLPPIDGPPSPESTESHRSSLDARQQISSLHLSSSHHSSHSSTHPHQPLTGSRTAPPIARSGRFPYPHPNAESPTKGFPYAFPDPEESSGHLSQKSFHTTASSSARTSQEIPFSRSPELRVSHKLAERKRRKEMKELFEELREALPNERCAKTSKWEILMKAIGYLKVVKAEHAEYARDVERLKFENSQLRWNQEAMQTQINSLTHKN